MRHETHSKNVGQNLSNLEAGKFRQRSIVLYQTRVSGYCPVEFEFPSWPWVDVQDFWSGLCKETKGDPVSQDYLTPFILAI